MRLVDADYIKESVKRQCDNCRKEGMKWMADSVERAIIEELDNTPSAQPQWIPCSERLPEENDDYWVTADPRYIPPNYKSTDIVSWYEGKWLMADYFVLDGEKRKMPTYKVMEVNIPIIAWMPLPKPYGGESDES